MPRRMPRGAPKTRNPPEPVLPVLPVLDVIDLTQESPTNVRHSRAAALDLSSTRDIENIPLVVPLDVEPIATDNSVLLASPTRGRRKARNPRREIVIDLDDTSLDDSSNNGSSTTTHSNNIPSKKPLLTCPICFESLASERRKAMTTPCGHVYCLDCLEKIGQTQKKCSMCQRPLKLSKCIRIHI